MRAVSALDEEGRSISTTFPCFERDVCLWSVDVRSFEEIWTILINRSRPSKELHKRCKKNSKTILEKGDSFMVKIKKRRFEHG